MGILRVNQISGTETQLSTLGIGTTASVTGSVSFTGVAGTHLSISTTSDFSFQNADFTIEFWVHTTDNTREDGSFSQTPFAINGEECRIYIGGTTGKVGFKYRTTNSETRFTLPENQWTHLALVRRNSVLRFFQNGIPDNVNTLTDGNSNTNGVLTIGAVNSSGQGAFLGNISNLRILRGTAGYTTDFTPPTTILEPIQDTVLLCCNNPDSAGAVSLAGIGTSKTITVNGDAVASSFNPGLVRNFTSGTQFTGVTKFDTQGYFVPPSGTTTQSNRGRGLFGGGENVTNTIDYIQIQSQGIAVDFGDLTEIKRFPTAASSSTRGVWGGGAVNPGATATNVLDYVTISTTSNAIDFGDLAQQAANDRQGACSNSTRGLWAGNGSFSNVIQYITIASIGNSQDFGDLIVGRFGMASFASPTRGIFAGGANPIFQSTIEYVTISSTGSALTFGNIASAPTREPCGCASAIRGVYGSGQSPAITNTLEYITIASTGNGTDFGDLTQARAEVYGSTSNSIRGVWAGGQTPTAVNTIDYIIITSTGNAQDFGDLTVARSGIGACSDSHGGIS